MQTFALLTQSIRSFSEAGQDSMLRETVTSNYTRENSLAFSSLRRKKIKQKTKQKADSALRAARAAPSRNTQPKSQRASGISRKRINHVFRDFIDILKR